MNTFKETPSSKKTTLYPVIFGEIRIVVNLLYRINCEQENFKYEVQEKSPANQAITMQQLAEEYWR